MIIQVPQVSCILASKTVTCRAKRCEEKDQNQGRQVAVNRREVTASFLTALAILGATHTALDSTLLREHRAAQTVWVCLSAAAYRSRSPGAHPAAQPSALVLRHPIGRAVQGKLAALHRSEGWHSNRLLKKKSSSIQINL